jgi:predicted transposase YdaD
LVPRHRRDSVGCVTLPQSPHDKLFTEAFGTTQAARGMLQGLAPPAVLERLDLDTLAPAAGSFVDEALAGSQSDVLFSVKLAGRPAFVYVLLEHKSYVDRWVGLQLLRYVVRIWEQALREEPRPAVLPPIIPLVVHHSEGGWTAASRLSDLVDPVVSEVAELARLTPSFEYLVDDLSRATDEELLARGMGLLAGIAAIFLRDARSQERVLPMLGRMTALLRELWSAPDGRRAVAILLRYLCLVAEVDATEVSDVVKRTHPEAEELIMTIAEQLRQEGREEGREEGQRLTLLKLLRLRFHELPASALARIEAANSKQLDLWAERVLTAQTLEEAIAD